MPESRFFRRRTVWLPTVWGWLVIAVALGASGFILGSAVHPWLSPNEPAKDARVLVVEGWLDASDLDQAIAAFRRGRYERVVTTGGPMSSWDDPPRWKNFADRAADYLRSHGLSGVPVDSVPAPASQQDRTFLSAVMAREWLKAQGVKADAIDLYSAGVHARRSRVLYEMAFGEGVEVGVMAARPENYDPEHWWRSSIGMKAVMSESIGWAWTRCCFWPPTPGSHEERWAVPKSGTPAP